MRKYIMLFIMVLSIGCAIDKKETDYPLESTCVSVVSDVTDKHQLQVKANSLLQLFNCELFPLNQCVFRIRPITDRQLTPLSFCKLPNAGETEKNNTLDDPQYRKKTIEAFYVRVREIVENFNGKYDTLGELRNSECIRSLSTELLFLFSDTSSRKYLVVYSNLREKSDLYDSYKNEGVSSEMFASIIEDSKLLPEKLIGITVIFVFEAKDRQEDKIFMKLAEGYKMVIERRGGKALLQATDAGFIL